MPAACIRVYADRAPQGITVFTADTYNQSDKPYLPKYLGIEAVVIESGYAHMRMPLQPFHFAPNGYVHAGSVITLADTVAGLGCAASLPEGAVNFTTIELKSNFTGSAREGVLSCEARLAHGGRTTQVWDATVIRDQDDRTIAMFRCTQMILYPR